MTNKECDWEMCQEQSSVRVITSKNDKCQGCNKYHSVEHRLCPNHWRDLQITHAVFNLARLAIGATPPYRKINTI